MQRDPTPALVDSISNRTRFVLISGPGTVYIDMQAGKRFHLKERSKMLIFLAYAIIYAIAMLSFIFLDR